MLCPTTCSWQCIYSGTPLSNHKFEGSVRFGLSSKNCQRIQTQEIMSQSKMARSDSGIVYSSEHVLRKIHHCTFPRKIFRRPFFPLENFDDLFFFFFFS